MLFQDLENSTLNQMWPRMLYPYRGYARPTIARNYQGQEADNYHTTLVHNNPEPEPDIRPNYLYLLLSK